MSKGKSSIEQQMDKIFRHARMGSYGTRSRYKDSCTVFVRWLAEEFRTQNLRNLQDKHLAAYVKYRQSQGKSPKTIKNDLSAIRYMHDQVSRPRYELSDNKTLQEQYNITLEKTPEVTSNRAWTNEEYYKMIKLARRKSRHDVADVIILCRTMGLRITESVAISRAQAEKALRTGFHYVQNEAKGGRWRYVPLSPEAKEVFERRMEKTPRGGRLFIDIENGEKTHEVANKVAEFIRQHRDEVETEEGRQIRFWNGESEKLTAHGLRYAYIQERLKQEEKKGKNRKEATRKITKEVGHNRTDVINVYSGLY